MSSAADAARRRAAPALGTFERYLTLWVAVCIVTGIVLGRVLPGPFHMLGRMTVAEVNIPVAVLIWLMIVPMLLEHAAIWRNLDSQSWRSVIQASCWRGEASMDDATVFGGPSRPGTGAI